MDQNPLLDLTDAHRRVAANLAVPRTERGLLLFMRRHDADNMPGGFEEVRLHEVLVELEEQGLVKCLGRAADGDAALAAVQDDDEVVSLSEEAHEIDDEVRPSQAESYLAAVAGPRKTLTVDDDLWILTRRGLEALTGEEE